MGVFIITQKARPYTRKGRQVIQRMDKKIYFYDSGKAFGCFSNFFSAEFEFDGQTWRTSEHYYQAMKFKGTKLYYEINQAVTPKEAAELGREHSKLIGSDWDSIKDGVMYEAIKAKFYAHKDLQNILLSTGDAELVEHTIKDNYWGDGGDGSGKNILGVLLMRLRKQLCEEGRAIGESECSDYIENTW